MNDRGRGGIVVVFDQSVDGIELLRQSVKVVMNRNHELVSISGNLHNALSTGAKRGNTWKVSPEAAISRAVNDFFAIHTVESDFVDTKQQRDNYGYFDFSGTPESVAAHFTLEQSTRIKKVWFPLPDRIVAAYYLELWGKHTGSGESALYSYVINATNGKLLFRQRLTDDAVFTYRVWANPTAPYDIQDGPLADYQPHPTGLPDGSSPMYTMQQTVMVDGFNTAPGGGFDSWLANNANTTNGNNVQAYADWAGSNAPTGGTNFYGTTTSQRTFDYPYDPAQTPDVNQNQAKASIVQLFFLNNWMHVARPIFDNSLALEMLNFLGEDAPGKLRVLESPQGYRFMDHPQGYISVMNLASVRAVEEAIGQPVDPLRFRANVYIDGLKPWAEDEWVAGQTIQLGPVGLSMFKPIVRCVATDVNLETGERNIDMVGQLREHFGRDTLGNYFSITASGRLTEGEGIHAEDAVCCALVQMLHAVSAGPEGDVEREKVFFGRMVVSRFRCERAVIQEIIDAALLQRR